MTELAEKIDAATNLLMRGGALRPFVPTSQRLALLQGLKGEEREYFADLIAGTAERIEKMPVTYEQDGKGDQAVAYLHYFRGGVDAWITEKDVEGGVQQAFGLVTLTGSASDAEMGYVSITELVSNGVELDLYWEPKTLAHIKNPGLAARQAREADDSGFEP